MINQPVKEKNYEKSSAIFSRWLTGWPSINSTWSLTADDTTGSSSAILPAAYTFFDIYRGNSQLCGGPDATHCPVIKDKPGPTDRLNAPKNWRETLLSLKSKMHPKIDSNIQRSTSWQKKRGHFQIHLERKKSTLDPLSVSQVHYAGITCNDQPSIHPIRSSSSHLICTCMNDSACQSPSVSYLPPPQAVIS